MHCYDKISGIIRLIEGKSYFGPQFQELQAHGDLTLHFGPVAAQCIVVEAADRKGLFTHGSQKAKRQSIQSLNNFFMHKPPMI